MSRIAIYPNTAKVNLAPLRRKDIRAPNLDAFGPASRPIFTRTFILAEESRERGRIMGPETESYGIRFIGKVLPLADGLPVLDGDGSIVAGNGVPGAPGPDIVKVCAQAGIDAISDEIAF